MSAKTSTPELFIAGLRASSFTNGVRLSIRKANSLDLLIYIYVPDADAAIKRALDAGSKIVDPMENKDWGDHCGGVQDPFGHIWYIATPIEDRPKASG